MPAGDILTSSASLRLRAHAASASRLAASAASTTPSSWREASAGLSAAKMPDTTAAPAQPTAMVSAALLAFTPPMDTTVGRQGRGSRNQAVGHMAGVAAGVAILPPQSAHKQGSSGGRTGGKPAGLAELGERLRGDRRSGPCLACMQAALLCTPGRGGVPGMLTAAQISRSRSSPITSAAQTTAVCVRVAQRQGQAAAGAARRCTAWLCAHPGPVRAQAPQWQENAAMSAGRGGTAWWLCGQPGPVRAQAPPSPCRPNSQRAGLPMVLGPCATSGKNRPFCIQGHARPAARRSPESLVPVG